ncbi:MAG: Ig domain-containing protein, partial [Solobacterium sp.]|nr:Ig domain-containing protein [Solobacterium sp.]
VTLNKTELSLNKGQTETLTAEVLPEDATEKTLTWSSRNPAVASVDQNGKITAKSGGTTVIIAAVKGSAVKAECTVTVLAPVEAVKFSSDAVSVPLENTKKLSYAVLPEDATNKAVTFSSNDSSVASVDDNGVVTGHKLGASAVITVKTMDGNYTDQCTVTVVEEGLIVVGLEDHYKYTGSPIRPAVQVYYDGELLTEKTDYTISYVNNTNAAKAEDEVKAPAVVIKGTGNFVKEARETFTIDPIDMDEVSAEAITLVQSAKAQVLKPKVTWKGKTLKLNTDYSVNQQALNPAVPGEYNVILSGTGNFDKNTSKILVVTVAANNKDVVPVTKLKVSSKAVKYDDIRSADDKFAAVLNASGFAVKNGQTILSEEDDYEILTETAEGCEQAGTCTFVIKGREGSVYRGEKTVSIKINGTSISKAKPNKNAVYTGNAVTLEDQNIGLISGNMPLIAGEDYVIVPDSYEANINAGKASVMVEGRGAYMGRARISFTINPDTGKKTVDVKDTVFAKGGAIPEVTVMNHDNTVLQQGRDYTLKFSNNKGIGTGSVSVTFKGNYKGSTVAPATFRITKKNLSEVYITAPDLASKNNNKGNFKGKITLTDLDGKKLGSSDYTIVEYRRGIEILNKDSMINEGDVITAVIVGKGSYEGTATVSYSVVQTVLDLSKATIAVAPQIYTGEPIEIGEGDITAHTIKVGKVKEPIEYGTDYKVLYYENNVNKGKAKVTFIGMGRCSGIKTVTFSIAQRDVNTRVSAGAEYFAHAFGF